MVSETILSRSVLGIRYPLSRDPIFVVVTDPSKTIENILIETVTELEKAGKTHEAFQLQQTLADHFPFVKGQQYSKTHQIGVLPFQEKILEGETVYYTEVNFLKEHVGG